MTINATIEIQLSKTKLFLMAIGSIVFVVLGFWFIIFRPAILSFNKANSAPIDLVVGIAAILFFGLCFAYIVKKLSDNNLGLIIDNEGITDNSSGVAVGLIPWTDIDSITTETVANQNFLMINVKNPQEYIGKQTGLIKRKAMEINYRTYGSPISISANSLKCNFNDLYQMINDRFQSAKTK